MKKLFGLAILFLAIFMGFSNPQDKKTESTKFTITGNNWNKFEGDVITISVQDTVVEGVKKIVKQIIRDGKFICSGSIQYPQNAIFCLYSKDGAFKYKGYFILEPGETNLRYNPDNSKTIISEGKYNEIVLNKVFNDPEYRAKEEALKEYYAMLGEDGLKDAAKKKRYLELNKSFQDVKQKKFDDIRYNHPDPYARLLAIENSNTMVKYDSELDDLEKLLGLIPEIVMLRENAKKVELFLQNRKKIETGKSVKDFSARDITGEEFRLADVLKKNKYVLVEFWASWCSPCRAEIPYMKESYRKYKDEGFEIISFTLDNEKDKWEKATKEENIPWINVGDLMASKSPVVTMYGVSGVPTNYLVDQSGTIVATNLRREKLEQKLKELFGE
jgi:peroxiredoxin